MGGRQAARADPKNHSLFRSPNGGTKEEVLLPSETSQRASHLRTVPDSAQCADSTQRRTNRPFSVFHLIFSVLICLFALQRSMRRIGLNSIIH
jgi:hypothetical protein